MSFLQKLVGSFTRRSGAFLDQAVLSVTSFALSLMLARALGPEGFGQFALYLSILLVSQTIQRALILTPMVVHYFRDHTGSKSWTILSRTLSLALTAVALTVAAAFAATGNPSIALTIAICGLAATPYLGFEFQRRVMYLEQRPYLALLGSSISSIMQIGLAFTVATFHLDVLWALGGHAAAITIAWQFTSRSAKKVHTISPLSATELVKNTRSSMLWNLAASAPYTLYNSAAPMILGIISTSYQVGLFSASRMLAAPVTVLVAAIDSMEKPHASRIYSTSGKSGLKKVLIRNAIITISLGIPYVIIGLIAPTQVAHFLLGEKYTIQSEIIQIWFIISFLLLVGQPIETGLLILRRTAWYFYSRLCSAFAAFFVLLLAPLGEGAYTAIVAVGTAWTVATASAFIMLLAALGSANPPASADKPERKEEIS